MRLRPFIFGVIVAVIVAWLVLVYFLAYRVQVVKNEGGATYQNQTVCFCHNVNNNPHAICTSNQGLINGHTGHVNNGADKVIPNNAISKWLCEHPVEQDPTPTPIEEEPEVTPTPPEEPTEPKEEAGGWSPEPEGNRSTTGEPGVCSDRIPADVANINVLTGTPNDGKVEVQWSLPEGANQVHIRFGKYSDEGYPHALLNTPNDGNEIIGELTNGTNYKFQVAGVNGCSVGSWSKMFDPLP